MLLVRYINTCIPNKIPRGGDRGVREGLGMAKMMVFFICNNMELHNNSLCYAFPYQYMEFHITKILKESIARSASTSAVAKCDQMN